MSRSIDQEHDNRPFEDVEDNRANTKPFAQIAANGTTNGRALTNDHDAPRTTEPQDISDRSTRLSALIDHAAQGKPDIGEFIARLERDGVAVLPSIQSGGRLNGLSYRFEKTTFNGSALGRAYTARGVQVKRGVDYQADRDQAALAGALERGGIRREAADRTDEMGRKQNDSRARSRETGLTPSQQDLLSDVGKFRTVAAADLVAHRYEGNTGRFERDIRRLTERGFTEQSVITHTRGVKKDAVVVLTASGRNLLRRTNAKTNGTNAQQFYAGFVKPSEVPHDIGIYRMYQREAGRIEREGGKVRRVVLDFEFKKRVYGELNKVDRTAEQGDRLARKEEIAGRHGLKVVGGRVVLPDLRIEYETKDQEMEKVDLELATGHYKASQLEAKRAAGLKIYGPDTGLGGPAHHDPEIVSGLVSL